ncbi:hypothetical protein CLV30_101456 [Haloactinopolyspora alba]|uniref:Uncharacterized protein n=1 Tax=Haloactinopolyspora alba TaxID=648780 RepID=A0A2P8EGC0_9ACTN|nr:hypothetical protein [Haloactinopolyspora alba]PSL08484.1 hypothetical protein CLV30_101456 [Haloactinopolyspora alba]
MSHNRTTTEERRYRVELAVVIGVGVALAIVAVAAVLTINRAPIEEQENFQGLSTAVSHLTP